MLLVRLPEYLRSSPTRVITPTSPFTPSATYPQLLLENSQSTSTNSIRNSGSKSRQPNNAINAPLMSDELRLRTSKLEITPSSEPNSSAPLDPPRSSPKRILGPLKL